MGFFITDEIFAVAVSQEKVSRSFFAGLSTLPYIGWTLGTFLGAVLGNILPENVLAALGLALYGMFIAIVVPVMKEEKAVIIAVIIAAALSTAFSYAPMLKNISSGLSISFCAVVSAAIVAIIRPVRDEAEEKEAANES